MFPNKDMALPSLLFQAYAWMTLIGTMANQVIPKPIRDYLLSLLRHCFKLHSSKLTLVIEDMSGMSPNTVYDAAEIYLSTKITPNTERLKISKGPKAKNLTIQFENGEKLTDSYEGIDLSWSFVSKETENNNPRHSFTRSEKRFFELTFQKMHKEKILNSYVPFVEEKARAIRDEQRILKIYTLNTSRASYEGPWWEPINLEHPATFKTLAMDPDLKTKVIEDLNRFVRRKEFYERVGRAWKRGYLLYGPPGTGKSSLVAAMANHLKFDVYDLQLANIQRDSDLRKLLLTTANRSILVIEDIDCSVELPDRRHGDGHKQNDAQVTLSGLLNFIDGLWSSCGDERIIVFTTNHKEKLDPALLRPGRMDFDVPMSYCSPCGFRTLAANYLEIKDHALFAEIEESIGAAQVTPAEVAEALMRNDDPDVVLRGLIKFLKEKRKESEEAQANRNVTDQEGRETQGPLAIESVIDEGVDSDEI